MTWREAFQIMAADFQRRAEEADRSTCPVSTAAAGRAVAYLICVCELEYASGLSPHEGVQYLREKESSGWLT